MSGRVPFSMIYIIGGSRDGPLKVGIAGNPLHRLKELQTGNAQRLQLFWQLPVPQDGARSKEGLIHDFLRSSRSLRGFRNIGGRVGDRAWLPGVADRRRDAPAGI